MRNGSAMFESNRRLAKRLWNSISPLASSALKTLTSEHQLSVASGDLLLLDGRWYVTHTGLLGLARRKRCAGMNVQPVQAFCDPQAQRWAFQATVYKSKACRGFVGYGDADPPMSHSLCTAPKCVSPKLARSTGPCAKRTESESAPSRRSVPSRSRLDPLPNPRNFLRNLRMETAADGQFASISASSFASINWMPP